MDTLEALITRPTVPQVKMTDPGPDAAQLRAMLEAGAAAPDHGKLQPWRFLTIEGEARTRLGDLFADALLAESPTAKPGEVEKQRTGPLRAPLIIVVIAAIKPGAKVPEVEQIASAAAAAQNILLAAHALGFAGKWSTGRNAYDERIRAGLGVEPHEIVTAFLYVGSLAQPQAASPRPGLETVVQRWEGVA